MSKWDNYLIEAEALSLSILRIFFRKELDKDSVCANFSHTAAEGKTYNARYYNLDIIISVGYLVKSKRGAQFRISDKQNLK